MIPLEALSHSMLLTTHLSSGAEFRARSTDSRVEYAEKNCPATE
jgi:hypothetical protein